MAKPIKIPLPTLTIFSVDPENKLILSQPWDGEEQSLRGILEAETLTRVPLNRMGDQILVSWAKQKGSPRGRSMFSIITSSGSLFGKGLILGALGEPLISLAELKEQIIFLGREK